MRKKKVGAIAIKSFALLVVLGAADRAMAQDAPSPYPKMAPVVSSPYWFISRKEPSQMKGLPPILVFLAMVADWSDGTPAGQHHD